MTMYRLKDGQPMQPLVGIRVEDRKGQPIVHKEEIVFKPNIVVETDLDFDSWLSSRLVKVERVGAQKPRKVKLELENETAESNSEEDAAEGAVIDERVFEPDDDVAVNEEEEVDYEELTDGTFHCLHCGRILKTESGIIRHVGNH